MMIDRPTRDEYAPFYQTYLDALPEDVPILDLLESQLSETLAAWRALPERRWDDRYAPGKWSVRELAGHVTDTERIFAYRAVRAARGDATPLPGFDENEYVRHAGFAVRRLDSIADEFEHLRAANLALFRSLSADALARRGVANGHPFSVRAILHIMAGHEAHHLRILRERYLPEAGSD